MASSPTDTDTIMEQREELMVSPKGGDPQLRVTRFLKPSLTSIDEHEPPFHPLPNSTKSTIPRKHSLEISFNGWIPPRKDWKDWVTQMRPLYQLIWKEAGIHDAIINSTFRIRRNDELIIGFVEKWCCETNTFAFPWGEVTLTLEDMIMLGGYSVLGDSVFSFENRGEEDEVLKELEAVRIKLTKTVSKKASHSGWLSEFMNSGSQIEHEAFIAFWLSRFVFPLAKDTISKNVLPIAVRLARGTRMALAPAVLAGIHRDLRWLKESMEEDSGDVVIIWSPFQLVQVWVLKRFPMMSVNPNGIENGDQIFARWDNKDVSMEYVRLAIDSCFEDMCWCPYDGMWARKFCYNEKEGWILVDCGFDVEQESFARCLRVSELVGIDCDCIEQYLPHRVAMQFGLGQDLPGHVPLDNATAEIAWMNYTRPVWDGNLYFPSQYSEPCVTTRYLNWWNQLNGKDGIKVDEEIIVTSESLTSSMLADSNGKKLAYDSLVPPGFPPRRAVEEVCSSSDEGQQTTDKDIMSIASGNREPSMSASMRADSNGKKLAHDSLVRPGFSPRWEEVCISSSWDEGQPTIVKGITTIARGIREPSTSASMLVDSNENKSAYDSLVPPGFPPRSATVEVDSNENKLAYDSLVPSGFPPRSATVEVCSSSDEGQPTIAKDTMRAVSGSREPSMSVPVPSDSKGKKSTNDSLVPPGFPPKSAMVEVCSSSDESQPTIVKDISSIASGNREPSMSVPVPADSKGKKSTYDSLVPPGFPPKSAIVEVCSSSDESQPKIIKDIKSTASGNREPSRSAPTRRSSRTAVDCETFEKENIPKNELEREGCDEVRPDVNVTVGRIATPPRKGGSNGIVSLEGEKVECSSPDKLEASGSDFEARISKLEKFYAYLKAAKLSHRLA